MLLNNNFITLNAATTKSKLSPLLNPAEPYLCKIANISFAITFTLDFIDGKSYFITHAKHCNVNALN